MSTTNTTPYARKTKDALAGLLTSLSDSQVFKVAAYLDACIEELKDEMVFTSDLVAAQAGIKCVLEIRRSLRPT